MKLRSGREIQVSQEFLQKKFLDHFNKLYKQHGKHAPFKMDNNLYYFCLDLLIFVKENRFYIHEKTESTERFRKTLYDKTSFLLNKMRDSECIYDIQDGHDEEDICHFLLATRELSVNPYWQFPDSKLFRYYKFV